MLESSEVELTERQKNELEYHRKHAKDNEAILSKPFSWDVLDRPSRRWGNAYWQMYAYLSGLNLAGKRVLVVGCGFGDDALRLAKLGAEVHAFDLSPDSLSIARSLANREGLSIAFDQMPAETLKYASDFFDCIVARDIFHHVDVPRAMSEVCRVAKPGRYWSSTKFTRTPLRMLSATPHWSRRCFTRGCSSSFMVRKGHTLPKMSASLAN